jgi:hypothetical protein
MLGSGTSRFSAFRGLMMRRSFASILFVAVLGIGGCAVQQPAPAPDVALTPPRPLPFKGRLLDGEPSELPPSVAMSLSNSSPVTFSYREELSHDEYHIPLLVSALDPVTYVGAPLGDYGVTAFATFSIMDGDKVLADYTAKAHVTKSYSLYSEPTHAELERAARAAVREKIDQKIYGDSNRVAQAISESGKLPDVPVGQ